MRAYDQLDDFEQTIVDFTVERGFDRDEATRMFQSVEAGNTGGYTRTYVAVLNEFWKHFAEVNS